MLKPHSRSSIADTDEVNVDACSHDKVTTPVTPMTPVSIEALTALHNLIKEDAY